MRNPDSWQGHYGLRNPASELTVPSHGPRTHPSGVETGCAAFSVTRNSIRRQWTRSEDTTKQKKTLGLKERDAPREAWGSHSVCPAGNHHAGAILAWGQGSTQIDRLDSGSGTAPCSGWDLLRMQEPNQKRGPLWEGCQDWGLKQSSLCPPMSSLSGQAGGTPFAGSPGPGSPVLSRVGSTPGDQFCFPLSGELF